MRRICSTNARWAFKVNLIKPFKKSHLFHVAFPFMWDIKKIQIKTKQKGTTDLLIH